MDLISKTLQEINSETTEKVLPTLQNCVGLQEDGFSTKVNLRSRGLHMNTEAEISSETRGNYSKMDSNRSS